MELSACYRLHFSACSSASGNGGRCEVDDLVAVLGYRHPLQC